MATSHPHPHPPAKKSEPESEPQTAPLSALDQALAWYQRRTTTWLRTNAFVADPTPETWQRRAASSVTYLDVLALPVEPGERRLPEKPLLFLFVHEALPGLGDLTWKELVTAGAGAVGHALAQDGGKTRETVNQPSELPTLGTALQAAKDLYVRIEKICNGTNPDSEEARAMRKKVFGFRTVTRSQPGLVSELGNIAEAIRSWDKEAPSALQLILPEVLETRTALQRAQPGHKGRTQTVYVYSSEVQQASTTLAFILEGLLRHALGTGTKTAQNGFERKIDPKRHTDQTAPPDDAPGSQKGDGSTPDKADSGKTAPPPENPPPQGQQQPPPATPKAPATPEAPPQPPPKTP